MTKRKEIIKGQNTGRQNTTHKTKDQKHDTDSNTGVNSDVSEV